MLRRRFFKENMEILLIMFQILLAMVAGDQCDFEHGLCKFTQDKDDNWNWSVGHLETPTTDTGPSYDHTMGENGTGRYLYIESSGKNSWTSARLSSLKYPSSKSVCAKFYYHMFGKDAGRLSVYMRQKGKLSAPLWSITGNQGNEWMEVVLHLRSDVEFQVVLEATRGSGFRSDIAVDDIAITNDTCTGANNIGSSTTLLDAVIGTKRHHKPGGEMLPNMIPPNNIIGKSGNNPHVSKITTQHMLDSKFVTNLMICGLIFWSIVFIILCAIVWKSRRSKRDEKLLRVNDRRVNKSAISTQIEFENPCAQQSEASGIDFSKRSEQNKVMFPKTQIKTVEESDSFKIGLAKGPASFKDRYSFTAIDTDLYMCYEEERTAETWRQTNSGNYV